MERSPTESEVEPFGALCHLFLNTDPSLTVCKQDTYNHANHIKRMCDLSVTPTLKKCLYMQVQYIQNLFQVRINTDFESTADFTTGLVLDYIYIEVI